MLAPVKFDNPPVVEVACGVLFRTLESFKTAHVGLFWNRIKKDFPSLQEMVPIPAVLEGQISAGPSIQMELVQMPPFRRTLFWSAQRDSLIQLQDDRFLFNWKRAKDSDAYPSYAHVIVRFEQFFAEFEKFLTEEGLGKIAFRQFELSYVNILDSAHGVSEVGRWNSLIDHSRTQTKNRFLAEPELVNWVSVYNLPAGNGRLHITTQSAVKNFKNGGGEKVLRVELTARGIPQTSGTPMRSWFDVAHESITHGFADSTSPALHTIWQRKQ